MTGRAKKGGGTRARRLREEHGIGLDGPVPDLIALARACGAHVVIPERLPEGIAGAYLPRNGNPVILLNGADFAPRLRFTLAHELAHHAFNRHEPQALLAGGSWWLEPRANGFAEELLIPRPALERYRGRTADADLLVEVTNRFGASLIATAIRLKAAGVISDAECEAYKRSLAEDAEAYWSRLDYRDSLDEAREQRPWSTYPNSRLAALPRVASPAEQGV